MHTRIWAARGALALLLSTLLAGGSLAQSFRGSILGTVTDTSGAVVAGATVTAKNESTGVARTRVDGVEDARQLDAGDLLQRAGRVERRHCDLVGEDLGQPAPHRRRDAERLVRRQVRVGPAEAGGETAGRGQRGRLAARA